MVEGGYFYNPYMFKSEFETPTSSGKYTIKKLWIHLLI